MKDRADIVHENFLARVAAQDFPAPTGNMDLAQAGLSQEDLVSLFDAQALSRQLDRMSRKMQARGEGFYTIGSSGHEGNAAIAWACRPTDMAFLHYRSAAFQIARAGQVPGQTPLWDMLLSFAASSEDPISGGRHKVLGSKALNIPPQTSTIASHLPKAVGAAYGIGLGHRLKPEHQCLAKDAITICSFGDASLNHSTAQGAINTAGWTAYQSVPMPILFVCEDNGIGISTKSPRDWVRASLSARPGLTYFACNSLDVIETYAAAKQAAQWVRSQRKPAALHMSCVRLYGHAGADVQTAYLSKQEVEAAEANDPLLHTARHLVNLTSLGPEAVLERYQSIGARAERAAHDVAQRPKLVTSSEVTRSLVPPKRRCAPEATTASPPGEPAHMAKLINTALSDLMAQHGEIVLAGEDIGQKGGVYGVTQKLQQRFGKHRVIDSVLDEQAILGLAIGLGHNGLLPIPEIQFLAYVHNAEDQIRGEAATLSFFSNGQYTNPMVVRIAGLGYQRGFGGHFHNDNSIAALRDIPGVIIACPSNGRDAALMLRECVRLTREEQRVVIFLEPIALYMTRDLHDAGDAGWTHRYPGAEEAVTISEVGQHGDGHDLAIVTYGNGYYLSRQAERILREAHGKDIRIIDLRWLAPLPEEALLAATAPCRHVLIVDECRQTGSQSEALMTLYAERSQKQVARLTAEDCFIATGPAYGATLPSRDGIVAAALRLMDGAAA